MSGIASSACLRAAVACLVSLLLRAGPSPAAPRPADGAPPVPPIASVTDLGVVQQDKLVQCRDGTYSARVGHRAVWTFGDTCLRRAGVDGRFIDNSLAWNTDFDASGGLALDHDRKDIDGVPARFIPFTDNELAYNEAHPDGQVALWPGNLVDDAGRQRVLVFYGAILRGDNGAFTPIGAGIAVADPRFTSVYRPLENPKKKAFDPTYLWNGAEQAYTAGSVVVGDMLYAYGGEAVGLATHVHVARVPLAQALDKASWTYWNGSGWSSRNGALATIYQGGAAGDSVFRDAWLGLYVTVYQRYLDNTVYYRVAANPEGPWSQEVVLFTASEGTQPSYAARVHAEYEEMDGQVEYITYVKTTGFLEQELPLVKVTFGSLFPSTPCAGACPAPTKP